MFFKLIQFGAIIYSILCLLEAFFLPPNLILEIDNYFFLFAVLHLGFILLKVKELRFFLSLFIVLFIWGYFVDNLNNNFENYLSISSLLYLIKWPVLMVAFIGPLKYKISKHLVENVIDIMFIAIVFLNIFFMINPFGLGELFQNVFAPKLYVNFLYYNEPGTFRLAGSCLSPNDNAALFGCFALYYIFLRSKEYLYYSIIALSCVIVTQSRTVFISMFIIGVIYLFYKYKGGLKIVINKKTWIIFLLSIFGIVSLMFVSGNLQSILTGDAFMSNSLMVRYTNFMTFLDGSNVNKYLGVGIVNAIESNFGVYIDSEVVAVLIEFGWIGLFIWLAIIYYGVFKFISLQLTRNFIRYLFVFIFFISFTNYSFLNNQIGVVLSFFISICFFLEDKICSIEPIVSPNIE